jgi:hypothetical protein
MGGRKGEHARGEFTTTAALAAGDTVDLFYLPPGARIVGGFVKAAGLDTSTAITLNVGTTANPTLFFNGSTAGQSTGAVDRNMASTGTDYYTNRTRTLVRATVATGPTTGATGATLVVSISYTVEEPR